MLEEGDAPKMFRGDNFIVWRAIFNLKFYSLESSSFQQPPPLPVFSSSALPLFALLQLSIWTPSHLAFATLPPMAALPPSKPSPNPPPPPTLAPHIHSCYHLLLMQISLNPRPQVTNEANHSMVVWEQLPDVSWLCFIFIVQKRTT